MPDEGRTAPVRPATGSAAASGTPAPRRGHADPVKALLHRHRELCRRAVDPLEIAAGLEAHGVTDRTAARFRHRDVFSLAEELYARVPRGDGPAGPHAAPEEPAPKARWVLPALLPGAVCVLAAAASTAVDGPARLATGAAGVLGLCLALRAALRHGPLSTRRRTVPGARVYVCLLLVHSVYGDGLLERLVAGGPDGPWPPQTGALTGLALAVAPAAWCARLFADRARRGLVGSRGLADFAARTRPLLLGVVALQLAALAGLLALVGLVGRLPVPYGSDGAGPAPGSGSGGAGLLGAPGPPGALWAALALGILLFVARLLTVHGFPEPAAAALLAACAAQTLALASVLAGRVPGCDWLARPVQAVIDTWGTPAVPALVCGVAALALLARAGAALTRASAHATP
ncbi:hypothetical protein [Streptomyces sp. SP18CS02]|uniref:hypothetical protein n=1 Tax=Streptomyces sp. SP18CS02 TaxID=3002531 RepID=UPI002E796AA6|nr:hypothetical protein [Streptomyces sp. SP18CS02]